MVAWPTRAWLRQAGMTGRPCYKGITSQSFEGQAGESHGVKRHSHGSSICRRAKLPGSRPGLARSYGIRTADVGRARTVMSLG
jgi:hypothetical protein